MSEFEQAATEAGFTKKQVEFLEEFVAKYPHSHNAGEIVGLADMMREILEEDDLYEEE